MRGKYTRLLGDVSVRARSGNVWGNPHGLLAIYGVKVS